MHASFKEVQFQHCPMKSNEVAHDLDKHVTALKIGEMSVWNAVSRVCTERGG
jgi:hypothetical protein